MNGPWQAHAWQSWGDFLAESMSQGNPNISSWEQAETSPLNASPSGDTEKATTCERVGE